MSSFERIACVFLFLWNSFLLAACSATEPSGTQTAAPSVGPCSLPNGTISSESKEAAAELRRSVESGPLYAVAASGGGGATCSVAYDSDVITLEYKFGNGGWLRVKRNSTIEYTDQEARFTSPPVENAIEVLKRVEQAAFTNGCGIDWQRPETEPVPDDPNSKEEIYRGDLCNCQARIRRDSTDHVTGLTMRSAC
jgi:hypothetical protein